MTIRTTLTQHKGDQGQPSYPRLRKHKTSHHLVFLFLSPDCAVGLTPPYGGKDVMDGMRPDLYEDFDGIISLSNNDRS